jgi:hypothetical protein
MSTTVLASRLLMFVGTEEMSFAGQFYVLAGQIRSV